MRLTLAALGLLLPSAAALAPMRGVVVTQRASGIRAQALTEEPPTIKKDQALEQPPVPSELHLAALRAEGEAAILARRIRALATEGMAAQKERSRKAKLCTLKLEGQAAIADREMKAKLCAMKIDGQASIKSRARKAVVAQYLAEIAERARKTKLMSLRLEGMAAIRARRLMNMAYECWVAIAERARKSKLLEERATPAAAAPSSSTTKPRTASMIPDVTNMFQGAPEAPPPTGFEWGDVY